MHLYGAILVKVYKLCDKRDNKDPNISLKCFPAGLFCVPANNYVYLLCEHLFVMFTVSGNKNAKIYRPLCAGVLSS